MWGPATESKRDRVAGLCEAGVELPALLAPAPAPVAWSFDPVVPYMFEQGILSTNIMWRWVRNLKRTNRSPITWMCQRWEQWWQRRQLWFKLRRRDLLSAGNPLHVAKTGYIHQMGITKPNPLGYYGQELTCKSPIKWSSFILSLSSLAASLCSNASLWASNWAYRMPSKCHQ